MGSQVLFSGVRTDKYVDVDRRSNPGSYPTVNERTPVEIPFFGRCEGICPLISGWFQIRVNKLTQPIPGRRIETSAQTWRGGLFIYSCLEPAVHRAHPLPTLDIKGNFKFALWCGWEGA